MPLTVPAGTPVPGTTSIKSNQPSSEQPVGGMDH